MQNIIIINGVRQSGVTTKANELKEKIEGLGLGYKVAIKDRTEMFAIHNGEIIVEIGKRYDFVIVERGSEDYFKNNSHINANIKIINLDESDIVMRMIGKDLSKENVKEQVGNYLKWKKDYVELNRKWD